MIKDTIKAVRDAEKRADASVIEAEKKAADIKNRADADVAHLHEEARTAALKVREERMADARADGEKVLAASAEADRKAADELRRAAAAKQQEAEDAVIDELLK